jgi:NADH-quinone oxidoreductase chain G
MISIKINDLKFLVIPEISILEACKYVGIIIPRFCYHETLSIAGNCRMCLVEIEGLEKPVASCLTEISAGISVHTDSAFVKKARENVVEALLLNHPLDCPICDQAGECDLQDQTKTFGSDYSRFFFNKRGVEDKECGPLIKTIMTRCIHCTRCVRFGSEVAGVDILGTLNRGTSTEIGSYVSKFFDSEISGNVIDLCPVGALTSKPYGFKARPWELRVNESVDITDSSGSNIYINFKESEIFRVLPKSNESLNEHIISDKARFSYDSNNNNRIKNLFQYQEKKEKYKTINWTFFLNHMDSVLEDTSYVFNIIVNDDIGLNSLNFLKKVSYSRNNIRLYSIKKKGFEKDNLYIYGLSDKFSAINTSNSIAFILSLNPKLECSIVNTRLRTHYRNSLLSIVSSGQYFSSNMPTIFINLNISKALNIFEGKFGGFSKLLIDSESPLAMLSDSLGMRGLESTDLVRILKFYLNNVKTIKINETSNIESLYFLNIKNLNTNNKLVNNYLCLNIDDTFDFRKKF